MHGSISIRGALPRKLRSFFTKPAIPASTWG
jgi:hypothetical protein